jgi:hypothetical protein
MKTLRKEVHEFIRAAEALLSSESFDLPLTSDERSMVGMYAKDLCQRYPLAGVDGFEQGNGKPHHSEIDQSLVDQSFGRP